MEEVKILELTERCIKYFQKHCYTENRISKYRSLWRTGIIRHMPQRGTGENTAWIYGRASSWWQQQGNLIALFQQQAWKADAWGHLIHTGYLCRPGKKGVSGPVTWEDKLSFAPTQPGNALLRAGVNLIYIRDLLGHVSIQTTDIYARSDSKTKHEALEKAYAELVPSRDSDREWEKNKDLRDWLRELGHWLLYWLLLCEVEVRSNPTSRWLSDTLFALLYITINLS